ncbi:MAG: hypothetical protein AAF550_15070, partial [Myxococcota bacterium]
ATPHLIEQSPCGRRNCIGDSSTLGPRLKNTRCAPPEPPKGSLPLDDPLASPLPETDPRWNHASLWNRAAFISALEVRAPWCAWCTVL